MSTDVSASSSSSSPCLRGEDGPAPLGWLMAVLQAAIDGVMTGDVSPIQRASAVARLSNLYLRANRAAELEQANKALARRLAELERTHQAQTEQIAALQERLLATESGALASKLPVAAGRENRSAAGSALLAGVVAVGGSADLALIPSRVPTTEGRSPRTPKPPPRVPSGGRRQR